VNPNKAVSVIMPLYNAESTVEDSIYSVLNQTFKEFELIVVDDKSTDSGPLIVRDISRIDPRVRLISLEINSGAGVARNRAIDEATGRYIAFLDADDLWWPRKLELQINFMQTNGYAFTCTNYQVQDYSSGNLVGVRKPPSKIQYKDLLCENVIGCLTVIFDTEILGFRKMPEIRKRQDFALWLNILKVADCYSINSVLATYRIMPESISRNKLEMLLFNYLMFRKCEGIGFFKAFYYVSRNVFRKIRTAIF
jgi:glycosyltransferase involved in cell wall biosynthesis